MAMVIISIASLHRRFGQRLILLARVVSRAQAADTFAAASLHRRLARRRPCRFRLPRCDVCSIF